jgi:Spy/CpxP family protein refolding chaperone
MLPKSKLQAIGLLAAVALAGFAAGAATMGRAGGRRPADARERFSYSAMLGDELGLRADQRDSIRAIMRAHRPEMHTIMTTIRPQMDSLRARMRADIRAVLTPVQATKYDSLVTRERARWDSAGARRGEPRAGSR